MTNKAPIANDQSESAALRVGHWCLVIGHLLVIGIWSLVLSVQVARAQDAWLLTTADFSSQRVELQAIDGGGVTVAARGRVPWHVGFDRLLMLERIEGQTQTAAGRFFLIMSGGDRVSGSPAAVEGETLVWDSAVLGQLRLPLRSVAAIVRDGQESLPVEPAATEDVVILANGDRVGGIVSIVTQAAVFMQRSSGEPAEVPLDSVQRITFAAAVTAPPSPVRGFRVSFADGSAVTAASIQLAEQRVVLALPNQTSKNQRLGAVTGIEQTNGPVVWLSSVPPVESVQRSLFDLSWSARMDRSVVGEPIRFGQRAYAHGIGVHSYSRLAWNIDPSWKSFRTQYAMAGDLPYANVTVRIKLDGKVVREQTDFRGGVLAPPVTLDLAGYKQLVLEVDYGANDDVQDRFNWIEPAVLKNGTADERR